MSAPHPVLVARSPFFASRARGGQPLCADVARNSWRSSRGYWSIFARSWAPFYSDIRRPSIDPELMIRMLIVGYCYGIRFERKLCEEVKLHLGYRWFCRLELDDKVPDHSTFSVNRHGRGSAAAQGRAFWRCEG
jgi:hypothetical protein